jgi:hypothetical protein
VDIDIILDNSRYIAEVWAPMTPDWEFREPYPEETYLEINQWCINTLKYHARTAYHVFEFKKQEDLEWFLLRWS